MKHLLLLFTLCLTLTACETFDSVFDSKDDKDKKEKKDDKKDSKDETVKLFNGKNFEGWTFTIRPAKETPDVQPDPKETWSVKDGVIVCTGKPTGYMRTNKEYKDYKLHVEYRWTAKPGNSGIIVNAAGPDKVWPKTIEIQNAFEQAGDIWLQSGATVNGLASQSKGQRVKKIAPSSERPAGEWNTIEVTVKDDTILVTVNGVKQNEAAKADPSSGAIGLQSEGAPIEFRNVKLKKL